MSTTVLGGTSQDRCVAPAASVFALMRADAQFLAAASGAKRIISRDPSLFPVFLICLGIVGDLAALEKFPRVAKALERAQLVLFVGHLSASVVESAGTAPRAKPKTQKPPTEQPKTASDVLVRALLELALAAALKEEKP